MRSAVTFMVLILYCHPCLSWSEQGHHLIAVMAYEMLDADSQEEWVSLLKHHPRYAEDFTPPTKLVDSRERLRWIVGRGASWPGQVAGDAQYDRPNWHFQLGASLEVGASNAPSDPGAIPAEATLASGDLHIEQAIELCRRILRDEGNPIADRALALCWISHLVGEAHQPCNAGSLYHAIAFPDGDHEGRSIPVIQASSLHAFWDKQLGARFDPVEIASQERAIVADITLQREIEVGITTAKGVKPGFWLEESRTCARAHVYTNEVMNPINGLKSGEAIEPLKLSDRYLREAREQARRRAAYAARRRAGMLVTALPYSLRDR